MVITFTFFIFAFFDINHLYKQTSQTFPVTFGGNFHMFFASVLF